jgi:hypothetical protein
MKVPGMQQWNKGAWRKTAATSEEREDICQDLQEDSRAGDQRVFDWITGSEVLGIVESSTSSKTKEETSKRQSSGKNDDDGTPGPACALSENLSGRVDLRREQQEQLESNHRENRATGKEAVIDHRCYKQSTRKRNGGMLYAIRNKYH